MSSREEFDSIAESLIREVLRFNPALATEVGLHEYDYMMPRMSRSKIESFISELEVFYSKLLNIDKSSLDEERLVDYEIVTSFIETNLVKLRDWGLWKFYPIGFDACLSALFRLYLASDVSEDHRIQALEERVKALSTCLEEALSCIEDRYALWLRLAESTLRNIGGLLLEIEGLARQREAIELSEACARALERISVLMERVKNYVDNAEPGFKPMGRELYNKLLKAMRIEVDAETLLRIGYHEVEKYSELLERVSKGLGYSSIDRAFRSIRVWYGVPPEEAGIFFRTALAQLKIFTVSKRLVEVPEGESANVIELPPHLRTLIPLAGYVAPDMFGDSLRGYVLVTCLGKEYEEMCDYLTILNTMAHEAYPGHHVQFVNIKRTTKSLVRKILSFPPDFVEGWAHYSEWLAMEHRVVEDPRYELVVYRDSLWRALRLCIDVELGLGATKFEEAVNKLHRLARIPRPLAEADVYRHLTNPGVQVGYCYGKIKILELRERVRRALGDKYSHDLFHRLLLSEGPIPLSLLSDLVMKKVARLLKES